MRTALLSVAIVLGIAIAWVDSRPSWDDTGVTAVVIFVVAATLAAVARTQPWLWALAVGIWIPADAVIETKSYAAFLALAVAGTGAMAGYGVRRLTLIAGNSQAW